MNSFQVEQGSTKPIKSRLTSRGFFRASLLFATLCMVAIFTYGSSLIGFAQNLPSPRQVLGVATQTTPCTGAQYVKPKAIQLGAQKTEVLYEESDPQFYTIYGYNVGELRSAITNCELRKQTGDFHALTSYTLNWQYSTRASGGLCTLQNVKIGLATNQYFPRLADSQVLSAADRAAWDTYYASLVSHENEHLALNKKYASDLQTALTNISGSCSTIESYANSVIQTHLQLLNSANGSLDTQTNHGADTGAIL